MPESSVDAFRAQLSELISELKQLSFGAAIGDLDLPHALAARVAAVFAKHSLDSVQGQAASTLALGLKEWIEIHNQFLLITGAPSVKLERASLALTQEVERSLALTTDPGPRISRLEAALVVFQKALEEVLRELGGGGIPKEVMAAEYSPELEVALLGINPEHLLEPVLDLGCGKEQALCNWLRARGKHVMGFDRHLSLSETSSTLGIAGDWLSYDFGTEVYGTILSHQAFSLQFWHQHLASEKLAARYAQKYMALLAALKQNGSFVYTPGLPFIERHLPAAAWLVTRREFPSELGHGVSQAMKLMLGDDAAYACAIERR